MKLHRKLDFANSKCETVLQTHTRNRFAFNLIFEEKKTSYAQIEPQMSKEYCTFKCILNTFIWFYRSVVQTNFKTHSQLSLSLRQLGIYRVIRITTHI